VIVPTVPQGLLLFLLGGVFLYFLQAGGRTFYYTDSASEPGAAVGQLSFLATGTIPIWFLGLHQAIPWINGIAAALLLALSVALYEWARQTIWGRRFGLGWGEHVPEALCATGPYRYIRHPIYLSYLLAFLAALIALPHWLTATIFFANAALFTYAAVDDEKKLAASPLAAEYAAYRERTGMFLPSFSRAAPGR